MFGRLKDYFSPFKIYSFFYVIFIVYLNDIFSNNAVLLSGMFFIILTDFLLSGKEKSVFKIIWQGFLILSLFTIGLYSSYKLDDKFLMINTLVYFAVGVSFLLYKKEEFWLVCYDKKFLKNKLYFNNGKDIAVSVSSLKDDNKKAIQAKLVKVDECSCYLVSPVELFDDIELCVKQEGPTKMFTGKVVQKLFIPRFEKWGVGVKVKSSDGWSLFYKMLNKRKWGI